ncbi:MAG: hypothetical protein ACKVGY_06630 [Candidatus Poseidoniales archaeon]|jgi:hypothetical protein|tara:strand:- start:65 stop:1327 length:1263 start_codon:yes stop_codon:yes gene_type:complete
MEKVFHEWIKWFQTTYEAEPVVLYGKGVNDSKQQQLVRVWISANGEVPTGGKLLAQSIFLDKKKTKAANGLVIFRVKGSTPIVFSTKSYISEGDLKFNRGTKNKSVVNRAKKTNGKEKRRSLPLKKPFHWRCRECGEVGESEILENHCELQPKQLAPLSDEGKIWFEKFLDSVEWKYVSIDKLMAIPNISNESKALLIAEEAGRSLEQIMCGLSLECPSHYELFDRRNTHLRTSDLKTKKGFNDALKDSIKNHGKILSAMKTAPIDKIELGHIFDEFLSNICDLVVSDTWKKGEKIRYYSPSLKVAVTGTPDLKYLDVPVEMKTIENLPYRHIGQNKKNNFRTKVKTNYMTQVSIYSKAVERQWLLVLLISRQSGEFTVLPMSNVAYLPQLEKKLIKWSEEPESAILLEKYHQLKGAPES